VRADGDAAKSAGASSSAANVRKKTMRFRVIRWGALTS
jgi:hypothetical protein